MLNEPTNEKLYEMRLSAMAEAWAAQQRDAKLGALSFDERFALLVDAEHMARDNRRLARLLKDAELRIPNACIEDVKVSPARGIEKSMVRQLGSCAWITEHLNVLITGVTGWARATSRRRSARPHAGRVFASRTGACRGSSTSSRSRVPTARTCACSLASRRPTC